MIGIFFVYLMIKFQEKIIWEPLHELPKNQVRRNDK